jgi:cation diffusion facilitator family transporter
MQTEVAGRQIANDAARPLYKQVIKAACIGLVLNMFLGVTKLVAGIATGSFALVTDAINSLGDVLTTVAVLLANMFAQKPPDSKHPYGHTKAEAVAAVNVSLIVFLSAVGLGVEAVRRIPDDHLVPPLWTLLIAAGNVVIKEVLYQYKARVARETKSRSMMANAWDHRSDALSALAVLVGLLIVNIGGSHYMWADEVAALFVVVAISYSAVKLFHDSASELMDAQADPDLVEAIRRHAQETAQVHGIETLWVRKSGLEYFVDIHIELDPEISILKGHEISHSVRDRILDTFAAVRDVLVHIEPYEWPTTITE